MRRLRKKDRLSLLVQKESGQWEVWISLPGHHPIRDLFGFCIGWGATPNAAQAQAVRALEDLVERLQQPPGATR